MLYFVIDVTANLNFNQVMIFVGKNFVACFAKYKVNKGLCFHRKHKQMFPSYCWRINLNLGVN